MLAYAQPVGGGGLTTFLTTLRQGPRNLLPLLTCWGWGADNVLDDFKTGSTGLVAVLDASRREKKRNG